MQIIRIQITEKMMTEIAMPKQFEIARTMLGMSQIAVARQTKLSQSEISRNETGKSRDQTHKLILKKFYERNGIGFGADGLHVFKVQITCDSIEANRRQATERKKYAALKKDAPKVRFDFLKKRPGMKIEDK